jgi:hypothetical protein
MEQASMPLAEVQQYADALRRKEYEARHPQTPAKQSQQPNTGEVGQAPTATAETPTEGEQAATDTRTPAQRTYDDMQSKYGEKASHKVDVTLKDRKSTLDTKKKALDKAQADYDDAPIGKEDKAEAALAKAQEEYDNALADYNSWDEVRKLRDQALLAQSEAEDAARKAELERKRAEETEAQRKQREEYEADQARRKAEAEAKAIELITQAVGQSTNPANYLLAQKYIQMMQELAEGDKTKTVYLPYEATNLLGSIGGIKDLFKE